MSSAALGFLGPWIQTFVLILMRLGGLLAAMPILNQFLPNRFKAALAVLVAMAMALQTGPSPVQTQLSALVTAMLLEVALGLLIGFLLTLSFSLFHIAGQIMGMQMGLGFGGYIDPVMQEEALPSTRLITNIASLVFLASGGIEHVFLSLSATFKSLPPGKIAPEFFLERDQFVLSQISGVFKQALILSMPILAGMLMIQVLIGIFTRAVAELNMFMTSFSLLLIAGIVLLFREVPYTANLAQSLALGVERQVGALIGAW